MPDEALWDWDRLDRATFELIDAEVWDRLRPTETDSGREHWTRELQRRGTGRHPLPDRPRRTAVPIDPAPATATARRRLDRMRGSAAAGAVADAARRGLAVAQDTASNPEKRKAFVAAAYPVAIAMAEGAELRNRKDAIKVWRVAKAGLTPQLTVRKLAQGAAKGTASKLRDYATQSPTAPSGRSSSPDPHTSAEAVFPSDAPLPLGPAQISPSLAEVAGEWQLDGTGGDLASWRRGMALYESSDFGEHTAMKESAGMMCDGPRHQLHRDDIILVVDPAEAVQLLYGTLWNVTAAVVHGNVETTWGPEDERRLRLALTLIRKFGVQAQSLGGSGEFAMLFDEVHEVMVMAMALSRTPWAFDLGAWFRQPCDGVLGPGQRARSSVDSVTQAVAQNIQPGWYEDPFGRFDVRYFDGIVWTSHVSGGGQRGVDPNG